MMTGKKNSAVLISNEFIKQSDNDEDPYLFIRVSVFATRMNPGLSVTTYIRGNGIDGSNQSISQVFLPDGYIVETDTGPVIHSRWE